MAKIVAKGFGVTSNAWKGGREFRVEWAYSTNSARRKAIWHSEAGLVPRERLGDYTSSDPLNAAEKAGWDKLRRTRGAKVVRVLVTVQ